MTAPQIEWAELAAMIAGEGPFIAGAGPISDLRPHFHFGPGVPIEKLTHGISLAYPLSGPVIEECEKGPTVLYKHHYRQVNMLLDRVALKAQGFIQSRGGMALPVPASVFSEWATQAAHLSHKMIAVRAGIEPVEDQSVLILLGFQPSNGALHVALVFTNLLGMAGAQEGKQSEARDGRVRPLFRTVF